MDNPVFASPTFPGLNHHRTLDEHDVEYSSFASDCPDLSSSLSLEPLTPTGHRRPSMTPSVSWEPGQSFSVSSLDTTAPSTPIKSESLPEIDMMNSEGLPVTAGFDTGYCYTVPGQPSSLDYKWFDEMPLGCSGEQPSAFQNVQQLFPYPSDGRSNLCLSRLIFVEEHVDTWSNMETGSVSPRPWSDETIDPSKAFLEPVTSPGPFDASPISPTILDSYRPTSVQFKSSPPAPCSPLEVRTQRRAVRKRTPKRTGSLLNSLPPVIKATNKFKCTHPDCKDKGFKRAEHLKRHMKCHSDMRPFKCELCGRGFSRSDNRRAHYDTHGNKTKGRNAYYEECDPESVKFKFGKKANVQKGRVGVKSKL